MTKVLKKNLDLVLRFYLEDEPMIVDEKYSFVEEKQVLKFTVDLGLDEVPVVLEFKGEKKCEVDVQGAVDSYEGTKLKDLIHKVMKKFIMKRDQALEELDEDNEGYESPTTPDTPIGVPITFATPTPTYKLALEEDEEEEEETFLGEDVKVSINYFGEKYVSYISGANLVKITGFGKIINEDCRKLFGIDKGDDSVTVSLVFEGEDYNAVIKKTPKVVGNFSDDVFRVQITNIVRAYVESKWEYFADEKLKKEKISISKCLSFIDEEISKETKGSTTKFVVDNARTYMVKKWIKDGFEDYAKSLCLYFCEMDLKKALKMYIDNGGKMEKSAIEAINNYEQAEGKTNFVLEAIAYVCLRMKNCVENCCICDERIECFTSEKRLPTLCTGKCLIDYVSRGKCHSIPMKISPTTLSSDLEHHPNVVDMLISFCLAAVTAKKKEKMFVPFPSSFLKKDGTKDFVALEKCIASLPSVDAMVKNCGKGDSQLKKFLGEVQYNLLTWILTFKRRAMLEIPKKKHVENLSVDLQFLLSAENPKFDGLRQKYGSFFAFFGPSMPNWLRVMKGGLEPILKIGANQYGEYGGDYQDAMRFYPKLTYWSQGSKGQYWGKSRIQGAYQRSVCVCEIIKHPDIDQSISQQSYKFNGDCAKYIAIRFILFSGKSFPTELKAADLKFHEYLGLKVKDTKK